MIREKREPATGEIRKSRDLERRERRKVWKLYNESLIQGDMLGD